MLAVLLQPATLSAGNPDAWHLDLGNKRWEILFALILSSSAANTLRDRDIANLNHLEDLPPLTNLKLSALPSSSACSSALSSVEAGLTRGDAWALKMLDADGKLGPGFLQGNVQWVGRYSECANTDVAMALNGSVFYLINFAIHLNVPSLSPDQMIPAKLGSCFPQACNITEV